MIPMITKQKRVAFEVQHIMTLYLRKKFDKRSKIKSSIQAYHQNFCR